jgi:hypothetical protein
VSIATEAARRHPNAARQPRHGSPRRSPKRHRKSTVVCATMSVVKTKKSASSSGSTPTRRTPTVARASICQTPVAMPTASASAK